MKAIIKTQEGFGHIVCRETAEPSPQEGEVRIGIAYAGICGTDTSIFTGAKPTHPPIIMGHEFSGVITETGEGVTGWKPGDRVVAETTKVFCGHCEFCRTGQHSLCPERGALGQQVDGVFAESVCQKAEMLHRIPDGVSLLEAAMIEPAACCCHAVYDLNDIKPTDTVVVIGPGPMGLITAQLVKAAGAKLIVAGIACDRERLKLAAELGADRTVVTDEEDLKTVVDGLTAGRGADIVFDCAGFASCIDTAFDTVRRMGTVVQVGIPNAQGVTLRSYDKVMLKELRVLGSFSHRSWNWDRALELVERGLLRLRPLISHSFTLEEGEQAFAVKDKTKIIFNIHPELDEQA